MKRIVVMKSIQRQTMFHEVIFVLVKHDRAASVAYANRMLDDTVIDLLSSLLK